MRKTLMNPGILAAAILAASFVPPALAADFIWPNTGRISSTWKYPDGSIHTGSADIAAATWTHIGAARGGTAHPYRDPVGANSVKIAHGHGYHTIYKHMVRWPSVRDGQKVDRNHLIGYVGSTGNSTGPHCHFAIMRYGTRLIIPHLRIGDHVRRGRPVPGNYAGLP